MCQFRIDPEKNSSNANLAAGPATRIDCGTFVTERSRFGDTGTRSVESDVMIRPYRNRNPRARTLWLIKDVISLYWDSPHFNGIRVA